MTLVTDIQIDYRIENGIKLYMEVDASVGVLDMSGRKIVEVDLTPLSDCRNLRELDLTGNWLTSLDLEPLGECYSLERLRLGSNLLTSILLYPLSQCTNLVSLSLAINKIDRIDLGARSATVP